MSPLRAVLQPFARKREVFIFLLSFAGICRTVEGQINAYAKVTGLAGNTLTLSNINQTYHTFAAGEDVILIQMQDAVIGSNNTNTSSYGTISSIVSAGLYRVYTISSISGSTMTLTGPASGAFNPGTSLQVVSYNNLGNNYTMTANITPVAWDGKVGGVVAFQLSGTLTLKNNISADAAGFRLGNLSNNYEVTCEPTVYLSTSPNYAYKAEGIQSTTYGYYTGRGPLASGGGGGSDDNGGGGGGSNYTSGGQGGLGWTCTVSNASGGLGGVALVSYISGGRVFMGGGGGGGQQNNGVGSAGANGGGIIFIRANKLVTSCSGSLSITAAGGDSPDSQNDGSGGAGAGGTIVLAINTFAVPNSCPLTIASNGGNGGNVNDPGAHGGGGGGGQGAVIFSAALPTSNITTTTKNGIGGLNNYSGSSKAGDGAGTDNAGIMSGTPVVLPVDFLSFTAEKSGQENIISWSTSKTLQAVRFTVERSADGRQFNDIGALPGVSDGGITESYVFTDAVPPDGRSYYRVRETDLSGGERYTAVALVDRTDEVGGFHIFPNPVHGAFTIQLRDGLTAPVAISIEDLSGATVYRSVVMAAAGRINVAANPHLTAAIYLVRVETRNGVQTGKLIVY